MKVRLQLEGEWIICHASAAGWYRSMWARPTDTRRIEEFYMRVAENGINGHCQHLVEMSAPLHILVVRPSARILKKLEDRFDEEAIDIARTHYTDTWLLSSKQVKESSRIISACMKDDKKRAALAALGKELMTDAKFGVHDPKGTERDQNVLALLDGVYTIPAERIASHTKVLLFCEELRSDIGHDAVEKAMAHQVLVAKEREAANERRLQNNRANANKEKAAYAKAVMEKIRRLA